MCVCVCASKFPCPCPCVYISYLGKCVSLCVSLSVLYDVSCVHELVMPACAACLCVCVYTSVFCVWVYLIHVCVSFSAYVLHVFNSQIPAFIPYSISPSISFSRSLLWSHPESVRRAPPQKTQIQYFRLHHALLSLQFSHTDSSILWSLQLFTASISFTLDLQVYPFNSPLLSTLPALLSPRFTPPG